MNSRSYGRQSGDPFRELNLADDSPCCPPTYYDHGHSRTLFGNFHRHTTTMAYILLKTFCFHRHTTTMAGILLGILLGSVLIVHVDDFGLAD